MVYFAQTVNAPGAASFTPPKVDSSWVGGLYDDFIKGKLDRQRLKQNDQVEQLNQQRIAEGQRHQQLAEAFQSGGALDAKGNFDPQKAQALFAKFGILDGMTQTAPLAQRQQAANTPAWPPADQPSPATSSQGAPGGPLPAPTASAPQGDASGSVISRVTDALPPNSDKVGVIAGNMAKTLGVDPNAPLTSQQAAKIDGYLSRYRQQRADAAPPAGTPSDRDASFSDRFSAAPGGNPPSAAGVSAAAPQAGTISSMVGSRVSGPDAASVGARIAQTVGIDANTPLSVGQQRRVAGLLQRYAPSDSNSAPQSPTGGSLPPSAAGVSPSADAGVQRAPIGAPAQSPAGGSPLGPQPQLPPGYTDPQQAVSALRQRAAQLETINPYLKPKADELRSQADRIEKSFQPREVHAGTTLIDPRSGRVLYSAPSNAGGPGWATRPHGECGAGRAR